MGRELVWYTAVSCILLSSLVQGGSKTQPGASSLDIIESCGAQMAESQGLVVHSSLLAARSSNLEAQDDSAPVFTPQVGLFQCIVVTEILGQSSIAKI